MEKQKLEMNLSSMCDWERKKAIFLLNVAEELGMNTSCFGQLAVNPNSGYTYLWLEDYNFTLYMAIDCELKKSDVYALYSCPINGEETEMQLEESTKLEDLEHWAKEESKKSEEKEK